MTIGRVIQKLLGRSDVHFGGDLYMRRWRLPTPFKFFGVRVHHIVRSDQDRELHDHPFSFVSVILTNGYFEWREDGTCTYYKPGSVIFRKAETLHRLELRPDGNGGERPVWTLVFRGPRRRDWGFLTKTGWLHWKSFTEQRKPADAEAASEYSADSSI